MRNYIIITKQQADIIRGNYGEQRSDGSYPARIEPVELPDGMFMIPEVCLQSKLLKDAKPTIENFKKTCEVQDIKDFPKDEKAEVKAGEYYLYKEDDKYEMVKVKQDCKVSEVTKNKNLLLSKSIEPIKK